VPDQVLPGEPGIIERIWITLLSFYLFTKLGRRIAKILDSDIICKKHNTFQSCL